MLHEFGYSYFVEGDCSAVLKEKYTKLVIISCGHG